MAKNSKTQELEPVNHNNLTLPSFMEGQQGAGTENISFADIEVPRIKLMQSNSPELEVYDWLRNGDFLHTSAEESLGKSVKIVPIYIDQQYILWNPRENGGGILARAWDGIHWSPANAEFKVKLDKKDGGLDVVWRTSTTVASSRLDQWGTLNPADPKSPPAATRMYNIVCAFPEHPNLQWAVVTMQRSAIKIAKRLLAKLKTSQAPMYGMVFEMRSVEDKNPVGQKFNNYQFVGSGLITDEEVFIRYKTEHQNLKKVGLNIRDIDTVQEDVIPDDVGESPQGSPKY